MLAILTGYPPADAGLGAGWLLTGYEMPGEYRDTLGKEYYSYSFNALVFGISVRITGDFRFAMYQGPAPSGRLRYQSETMDSDMESYQAKPKWFIAGGATSISTVEYHFLDHWLAELVFIWQGAQADTGEFLRSQSMVVSLPVGYGYSF